jgi:hypothetical protein
MDVLKLKENKMTPEKWKKLQRHNPTFLKEVCGVSFYEHPLLGDEYPVIAVMPDGQIMDDWWDIPTEDEMRDILETWGKEDD